MLYIRTRHRSACRSSPRRLPAWVCPRSVTYYPTGVVTSVLSRVRMAPSPGVSAGTLEISGSRSSRWLDFWINVQHPRAVFFAYLVAAVEILIAIALITGFARKTAYIAAIVFSLLIWATAEGFGGPYTSGAADIGTA